MSSEKNKQIGRFNPLRILAVCGLQGATLGFIVIIGCGVYGLFVGTVLPIATIAKVAGIAFIVGCIMGAGKL